MYYRWIYWITNNNVNINYIDNNVSNFLDLVHVISFLGILIADIWWIYNLYQSIRCIPITFTSSDYNNDKRSTNYRNIII